MRIASVLTLLAVSGGLTLPLIASADDAEVNLYSARKEALIKPLLDRFTEDTGIEVNLVTGKADALLERLKSEGGNSPADLLVTVDAGNLYRAKEAGLTQAVESETLTKAVPATYRDPEGHWFGLSLRARPIMYATDRVDPEELSTYEALADERWHKRICIRSSSNVYNQSLVASIIAANGAEATEEWAQAIVANMARPPQGGDRDQIKAVAAGQCDIAIANTYYLAGMLKSDDPGALEPAQQVAVFWPNQSGAGDARGTHVNVSGATLLKSSRNQDAAVKLMEFLLTPKSQAWYADTNGEYPVLAGVGMSPVLAAWGEFEADDLDLVQLGQGNAEAVKLMDRAGWK